jgi:hypothetical protein
MKVRPDDRLCMRHGVYPGTFNSCPECMKLTAPIQRQATLSSAENTIYQELQHKLWADMQRVFPRLRGFTSPRNVPKIRVRPTPEEKKMLDKLKAS